MLKLNCDIGEGFELNDQQVMPFINQANIACGGHAGNDESMARTTALALKHNVSIGAHPSYPDTHHFGRISLDIPLERLHKILYEQISQLQTICVKQNTALAYIKAHGALYNDSMQQPTLMTCLLELAQQFKCALMIQALPETSAFKKQAMQKGVALLFEGFADRAYRDDGFLVSRSLAGAVHNNVKAITEQAITLADKQYIVSNNGKILNLSVDSLCVHGDSELALSAVKSIYNALH